ncbi:hypothetical protein ACFLZG_02575, partial [Thermodesulfobacteriota bacterium]
HAEYAEKTKAQTGFIVKHVIQSYPTNTYPTLGEINKKVAGSYFTPKIFSNRIKKGLKFFFNLKGRACGEEDIK